MKDSAKSSNSVESFFLFGLFSQPLLLTGLPPRSLPLWGAEPAAAGGRNLIRLASRSTFPIGEGKAGGSVVSKEASQAPPARCEATIANLTAAKQEVAARKG